jgi:protein-tyrosine phosphatase
MGSDDVTEPQQARQRPAPPADHALPYEIVPGLFISGHTDHSRDFLTKGVGAVVDLEGEIDTAVPERESQRDTTLYLYWPIADAELPNPSTVRSIAEFVADLIAHDRNVLVHCRSGHNRSGLICARTLIAQGREPRQAIDEVRSHRGDGHALENENFVRWLLEESPRD